MKKIVLLLVLPVLWLPVQSQIKVSSNNNVGIQSENPVSKLSVGGDGNQYSKVSIFNNSTEYYRGLMVDRTATGSGCYGWHYAVQGRIIQDVSSAYMCAMVGDAVKSSPVSSGRSYGVWARAGNCTSGYNHGVHGIIYGTNNGAAIFAETPGRGDICINNIYAGYFRGKVFIEDKVGIMTTDVTSEYALNVNGAIKCNGFLDISSDERLKADINTISKGSLGSIAGLRGVTYMLQEPEPKIMEDIEASLPDTGEAVAPVVFDNQVIYQRRQSGFLAQELQQVFPDLVTTDDNGMMSINYIGIIPYLVEAIKEQQMEIEGLRQEISEQDAGMILFREEYNNAMEAVNKEIAELKLLLKQ